MTKWASAYEVKVGDLLQAGNGLGCITTGTRLRVERDEVGDSFFTLFVSCSRGKHYISGHQNKDGELVGFSHIKKNGR
jgi:hypothetical protein